MQIANCTVQYQRAQNEEAYSASLRELLVSFLNYFAGKTLNTQHSARSLPHFALCLLIVGLTVSAATAQDRPIHYFQNAYLPPGDVATAQAYRGGGIYGYLQPVRITAPTGTLISIAEDGRFTDPATSELHVALIVGQTYRLRISNVPNNPEFEVFPSIEVINRLYPPEGQKLRFPLPIDLTTDDLNTAINGLLVTRVVYLEDPRMALPAADSPREQRYFDVPPLEDPLEVADRLGRPMAIVRMGSRVPDFDPNLGRFTFNSPYFVRYQPPIAPPNVVPGDRALEEGYEGQDVPREQLTEPDSPPLLYQQSGRANVRSRPSREMPERILRPISAEQP
jgi:hypothetical protein